MVSFQQITDMAQSQGIKITLQILQILCTNQVTR